MLYHLSAAGLMINGVELLSATQCTPDRHKQQQQLRVRGYAAIKDNIPK